MLTIPRQRRARRILVTSCLCVVLTAGIFVAIATTRSDNATSVRDEVLSLTERSPATQAISRDCGYSTLVPGADPLLSLWLFCDTQVYKHGTVGLFSDGGSAARQTPTPGSYPQRLEELPAPDGTQPTPSVGPSRFLTVANDLWLPSDPSASCGSDGHSYAAAWPSGVAIEPAHAAQALIVYDDVCVQSVQGSATISEQGLSMEEYDWKSNQVVSGPYAIYQPTAGSPMPDQWQLGSPVFSGDYLYLFSGSSTTSTKGVFVADVLFAPGHWTNGPGYYFWDGSSWSTNPLAAASILPAGVIPLNASSVSVEPGYPAAPGQTDHKGVIMMVTLTLSTGYQIWDGPTLSPSGWRGSPDSAWSEIGSGARVDSDCTQSTPPCRAVIGHPEFSTDRRLYVSYFDPDVNGPSDRGYAAEGHLRMAKLPY